MSRQRLPLIIIPPLAILFLSALFLHQCKQSEDNRFETYTDNLFRQEIQNNAITLHYTLKDPSTFHIYDTPLSLGHVSTDTTAIGAAAENALATLNTYNPDQLSSENQLIYSLLENTFTSAINLAPFALYEEPLSPLTGTQAQLPILLSEYQFYSSKDVDIYLQLLRTLPDYFLGIMQFETEKSKQGLFMTSERAEALMKECDTFIGMGQDHYLFKTFKNRIKKLNLPEEDYKSYLKQNTSIINEYIFPAYEDLKNHIETLKNTGINENGLCYFPKGKEYYELLVKEVTGSNRTILELKALTYKQINEDFSAMQELLDKLNELKSYENTTDISNHENLLQDSNPTSILHTLKDKLNGSFPSPPNVNISVKYVDESMEEYLSPAFYLIPAIDNAEENIIYINPAHMSDDLSLFTTLAHEGYPGHLYQTTYFANTNPSPIRNILGCGGYTEGWATYCEMMSYYFAPISKADATIMQKNSSIMLGLYALADMGIHYEGWTLSDTIDFFFEHGIYDTAAIEEIFNLIIGDPGNYLKYYIGYLEFLELKKDAIYAWGKEFSQERFHREILEAGPMPFTLLRNFLGI